MRNLMTSGSTICFAYDANDPADKKILKDAIDAALAEAETEHEQNITGLKDKNKELVKKLNKAQEGKVDPQEVERLTEALEKSQNDLKTLQKDHKKISTTLEETSKTLETDRESARKAYVDSSLTESLTAHKVPVALLGGAKALLASKVIVEDKDGTKLAKVGDKSLGDYIKEWSQGDEGKHYVAAASNGGGGAGGARHQEQNPNITQVKRSEYDADPGKYAAAFVARTATLVDD